MIPKCPLFYYLGHLNDPLQDINQRQYDRYARQVSGDLLLPVLRGLRFYVELTPLPNMILLILI